MRCLKCNNKFFSERNISMKVKVKGLNLSVKGPSMICTSCSEPITTTQQMSIIRKLAADAYKKKKNLLTSDEIQKYRARFSMSQSQFAKYLGVGEASVKRWETFYIQEPAHDQQIRLKCDPDYAERNAKQVRTQYTNGCVRETSKSITNQVSENLSVYDKNIKKPRTQ